MAKATQGALPEGIVHNLGTPSTRLSSLKTQFTDPAAFAYPL